MLHRRVSKKLVVTCGLVVAMGALGADQAAARERVRTEAASKASASPSNSGRTAVSRSSGNHSRGASSTRSRGNVERSRSRGRGGHVRSHRHGRRGGYLGYGLGYYGRWGAFYGGYGGYYYSPFYFGYPVYHGYHPARYSDFGSLDLNVRPKKTEVWVDGQYVGTAGRFDGYPGHLWLGDGRHELIFYKPGYVTVRREVNVLEGVVLDIHHDMVPGESVPVEELTAFGGQQLLGTEPEQDYREPAREPREPRTRQPQRQAVREDAREEPGRLRLDIVPEDASIYLDGRFLGTGRELARLHSGLMVSPGEHTLEAVRPGFDSREVLFSVEAGEETELRIDLDQALEQPA